MSPAPPRDEDLRPVGRFEWERMLMRITMPKGVRYLALVMATFADPDGTRVRPGVPLLADCTEESPSTVKRSLRFLRDLGLYATVSRGGGRAGSGKTAVYRLTLPVDLIDRGVLKPLPGTKSEVTQVSSQSVGSSVDNSDSEVIQVTPQFENSDESEVIQVTHENDFQGSETPLSERLRGQISGLRGHLGDLLPTTTNHIKMTNHSVTTQRNSPPRDPDAEEIDSVESKPAKCPHGLRAHVRDNQPACPLCRRASNPTNEITEENHDAQSA